MRLPIALAASCLTLAFALPAAAQDADPRIERALAQVSAERLKATVEKLAAFGTRHTLSSQTDPNRGIGAAAQWIHDQLVAASPRLKVSFDDYEIPAQGERILRDVRIRNVVAVLPGKTSRRIYVSGHYDTVARPEAPAAAAPGATGPRPASANGGFDWANGDLPAPGANDDGSGTALTMEAARVLAQSGLEFDATLVFVAFAGEEQGLVGAHLHAQKALAEKAEIDAVFNNDIVGNSRGGNGIVDAETVRVFAEGPEDSGSRQLARFIKRAAARYVPSHRVQLIARHDRFGRGGDHTAFNQRGYAGVRFSEANEDYSRQHLVADTPDGVDPVYLARNTRVNVAGVATLALAPAAPDVTTERGAPMLDRNPTGYDARLRWKASPGAVGYRIFWRDSWATDWQFERHVGNVTEIVLPDVSIDDHVFGVAAIGPGGHESLVSAYVNPPRGKVEVKTK
ncbi:aminopeptidase [Luteitalea sp. TBR-22]|uniref:M20/M25/M40 family metallo-hydrolase n=1 Tax=Luteitalea sp. TBR-22 TaxID=2802971 RepID=UPI001AF17DF1|nr:M20/M25/M40 family metallo-hydrolase [Luteitalea sp. TBR-22]BCS34464.1 aminopeptidase [Luteitalea sp. TBR-22]